MESFEKYADRIIVDVKEFAKTVEVIDFITDYANQVVEEDLSLDELNNVALKLSGLLCRLGTILSDLNNYANASISYRKLKRVNEFCRFKQLIDKKTEKYHTDGNAGAKADQKIEEDLKTELGFMARYNKINVLYEDTSRLVMSIQSYLKQEQKQMFAKHES